MSYGSTPPPPPPGGGGYPPPPGDPNQGGYGQQPPAYGQQPPAYGQQPAAYGQPAAYPAAPAGGGYYQPGAGALAQWPQRALGLIIDNLVFLPASILIFIGMPKTTTVTVGGRTDVSTSPGIIPVMLLGYLLMLGIWVWNRGMKGGQGQTIGRKLAGVKLVDMQGQPVGTGKALLRDIVHIVDSIICGLPIGWLAPLWDAKRQTWADKILNTQVVTVPK